jgi:hypothetical protein
LIFSFPTPVRWGAGGEGVPAGLHKRARAGAARILRAAAAATREAPRRATATATATATAAAAAAAAPPGEVTAKRLLADVDADEIVRVGSGGLPCFRAMPGAGACRWETAEWAPPLAARTLVLGCCMLRARACRHPSSRLAPPQKVVGTNVVGSLLCAREAIRIMRAQPPAPAPIYHVLQFGFSRWGAKARAAVASRAPPRRRRPRSCPLRSSQPRLCAPLPLLHTLLSPHPHPPPSTQPVHAVVGHPQGHQARADADDREPAGRAAGRGHHLRRGAQLQPGCAAGAAGRGAVVRTCWRTPMLDAPPNTSPLYPSAPSPPRSPPPPPRP